MDPRINVFPAPLPKSEPRAAIDPPSKNKFEKKPLRPKLDNSKASPQVPAQLQGLHLKTKDNKPLCWHKNLQKGHNNQVKKGRCKFGYHNCMKCLKPGHGAFDDPDTEAEVSSSEEEYDTAPPNPDDGKLWCPTIPEELADSTEKELSRAAEKLDVLVAQYKKNPEIFFAPANFGALPTLWLQAGLTIEFRPFLDKMAKIFWGNPFCTPAFCFVLRTN